MREKILIIIPDRINLEKLTKQQILEGFLKQKSYHYVCEYILKELDNIQCIQVYNDNVVRLHLRPKDHFSSKTSIFIEDYISGKILIEILNELLP